jgi:hypothetical protein
VEREVGETEDIVVTWVETALDEGELTLDIVPSPVEGLNGELVWAGLTLELESIPQGFNERSKGLGVGDVKGGEVELVEDFLPYEGGDEFKDGLYKDLSVPRALTPGGISFCWLIITPATRLPRTTTPLVFFARRYHSIHNPGHGRRGYFGRTH